MRLEWSSDQGLVREVIGKDSWFHSRSLLGLFPQTVLVYDKPGRHPSHGCLFFQTAFFLLFKRVRLNMAWYTVCRTFVRTARFPRTCRGILSSRL